MNFDAGGKRHCSTRIIDMEQSDLFLLQHVPTYHLQTIAKARNITQPVRSQGAPAPDAPLVELNDLGNALFDPISCQEAIRELSALEMSILKELAACGGRANSRDLALYLSSLDAPTTGKAKQDSRRHEALLAHGPQYPTPHPHGPFEQALHHLLVLGLLFWGRQTNFSGRDYSNGVYDGVLAVPQAVMDATQAVVEERHAQEGGDESLVGEVAQPVLFHEGIRELQRALYLYWSLVASQRDGLSLVNSRLLSRSALRLVIEQVSPSLNVEQVRTEADAPYLLFLRLLLMQLGVLVERSGVIHASPADAFFALSLKERARRCYHLWRDTPFWNELSYLPGIILRPGPGPVEPAHAEVSRARAMVLRQIAREQPGTWHPLSTFIARAKLYIPYLLFPREYGARAERYSVGGNPYGWDFRLKHGWLTHREGWHLVEGGFIRSLIDGPLRWLGLVETDESADTFTPTSAISLLDEETVQEQPQDASEEMWGRLVVQPNFELVALAPVSESLLLALDHFAERMRLEQIAQYKMTRASVTRAVQAGMRAEAIQRTLENAAGGAIPQNVAYSLVEWERQARRIELWPGMTLMEVDSEALLDDLYADEETRPLLGRRLSPTLAEVVADQLTRVQELLWQREFLPALVSAPAYMHVLESGRMPPHEAQWRLRDNGLLEPCYPVLNLYLAAEMERFTLPDEKTGWRRITPDSIQQAAAQSIPLDAIVRFLTQYCEGGLPASFLIRLKLWGGGYFRQDVIQVERMPLLRLSAQALRDIQADEELGELLDEEIPPDMRLVRVSPHLLDHVLRLLGERGFTIEE
jgi:hypothetical protein